MGLGCGLDSMVLSPTSTFSPSSYGSLPIPGSSKVFCSDCSSLSLLQEASDDGPSSVSHNSNQFSPSHLHDLGSLSLVSCSALNLSLEHRWGLFWKESASGYKTPHSSLALHYNLNWFFFLTLLYGDFWLYSDTVGRVRCPICLGRGRGMIHHWLQEVYSLLISQKLNFLSSIIGQEKET